MKHINMQHGQNTVSLNITACGTYSSTGLNNNRDTNFCYLSQHPNTFF